MYDKLLFIVGVGRSGTTLLQNMINSHSQVAFIPEINFTRRFLFNNKLLNQYKKGNTGLIDFIKNDKWLGRLKNDIVENIDIDKISSNNFSGELYKKVISINCQNQDKQIGGDKDPRSIEIVDKIEKCISNIHWIHIIRDPRDVIVSKQKADWSKNTSILKHIISGSTQLALANKWRNKHSKNFTEIYYEDLIQNPKKSLIKLCNEIGISYEDDMLNYQASAKKLVADDELSWKKSVFNKIKKDNHSMWKNNLNPFEIALVENINKHAFNTYGYLRTKPAIGYFNRVIIFIVKTVSVLLINLYILLRCFNYR